MNHIFSWIRPFFNAFLQKLIFKFYIENSVWENKLWMVAAWEYFFFIYKQIVLDIKSMINHFYALKILKKRRNMKKNKKWKQIKIIINWRSQTMIFLKIVDQNLEGATKGLDRWGTLRSKVRSL
jgi:hypothetical protein